MYIKNLTSKDLTFRAKGSNYTLKADNITLIPDGAITLEELQQLFGVNSVITSPTGPATSILDNQQILTTGKLYLTDPKTGEIRLFVGTSGTVDVYGSDSPTIPASFATMSCPDGNQKVSGMCTFGSTPRYIAFKANSGSPEIVITNCNCYEVKAIS